MAISDGGNSETTEFHTGHLTAQEIKRETEAQVVAEVRSEGWLKKLLRGGKKSTER